MRPHQPEPAAPRAALRSLVLVVPVLWAISSAAAAAPAAEPRRPLADAVTVSPGATCLSQAVLAEHIQTWLGIDSVEAGLTIDIRGDPIRTDVAAITLKNRDGGVIERTFENTPPTCSDMHAVVGLGVAMAIDASVLEDLGYDVIDSPAPAPAPQAVDSERPPRLRRENRVLEPEPPRRRPNLRAVAAVRGSVWLGSLPGVAGGGQLHGELGWVSWLDLRLGIFGGFTRHPLGSSTVDVGLVAGRFDVCAGVQRKRLRPRLCLGPGVGALQASGRQLPAATRGTIPWVAGMVALELRILATRVFSLDLAIDGAVPFLRPLIAVRDPDKPSMIGDSLTVAPVGVMFSLGGAFTIR
mgnify:CR=1 FL=1